MRYKLHLLSAVMSVLSVCAFSQNKTSKPKHYYCYNTTDSIIIDGNLKEESWKLVSWSEDFVDIEGNKEKLPDQLTRMKMLWNKNGLYVAAYLEEAHINASIENDETVIFKDNDFEVFIDPDGDNHNYYELEINAKGYVWDLYMGRPYRDYSPANTSWDIKGLETAIGIYGSINNPSDIDSCWIVEIFMPWESLITFAKDQRPPKKREVWRMNFSRVQWEYEISDGSYKKKKTLKGGKNSKEKNWVWSPQWVVNMHNPESWGYIIFAGHPLSMEAILAEPDPDYELKAYLVYLYRLQKKVFLKNQFYAGSVRELTGEKKGEYPVKIETTSKQFIIHCSNYKDKTWYIDQHRKLWSEPIQRQK